MDTKLSTMPTNNLAGQSTDTRKYVSEFLLAVLRHKPQIARLKLDENGFAEIDKIISYLVKIRKIDIDKNRLSDIVKSSMSKKIEIKGDLIRAIYGHSIILSMKIPDNFEPCSDTPRNLYGCVDSRSILTASKNGLSSNIMRSKLCEKFESLKQTPYTAMVTIDSEKAVKENVSFYVDKKTNTYFAAFVPAKFIHFRIK